jgi:hypothetical protein
MQEFLASGGQTRDVEIQLGRMLGRSGPARGPAGATATASGGAHVEPGRIDPLLAPSAPGR